MASRSRQDEPSKQKESGELIYHQPFRIDVPFNYAFLCITLGATSFGTSPRFGHRSMFSRTPRGKSTTFNNNSSKTNRIKSNTVIPDKGNGLPNCSLPRLGGDAPSSVARSATRPANSAIHAHIEAEVKTSPRDQVDEATSAISHDSNVADDLSTVVIYGKGFTSNNRTLAMWQAKNVCTGERQESTPSREIHVEIEKAEKQSIEELTPMKIRSIADIETSSSKTSMRKDLSPGALPKMSTKDFLRRVYATEATPATTCSTPFTKQLSFESSTPGTPSVSTKIRPLTTSSTVEVTAPMASLILQDIHFS
ncbi:hypothetical protein FOL47_007660 [Perkinsus chesapeaki]|uniref:Uncharacterized protein n=1 Tax=Perkinsus chesapeaki TaxID=330153 RepID=A0A7J6MV77_PERCH|nr:hypothetical protein FOL47_007660 [Perkinsus chesapeaki]